MKSRFVDECLSIAPLVTSTQPSLEHTNGCGIDNFIWQLVPICDDALADLIHQDYSAPLFSNVFKR